MKYISLALKNLLIAKAENKYICYFLKQILCQTKEKQMYM